MKSNLLIEEPIERINVAKWADYLISEVLYNDEETHIVNVLSHMDNGDTVSAGTIVTRASVVSRIENGNSYKTITKYTDGKWRQGAAVQSLPSTE